MNTLLFKISVFHEYFENGFSPYLELKANHDTQSFLNRYRLKTLKTQCGFELHYYGSNHLTDFIKSLPDLLDNQPLVFNIINQDKHFAIITDLPLEYCAECHYDSRISEQSELIVSLEQRTLKETAIVGLVCIYAESLVNTPHFLIKMPARKTHWHYYVINRSQLKITDLLIRNHQGIEFNKPQSVVLKNGEQALLFSSGEQRFAFSEKMKSPFNLLDVIPSFSDSSEYQRATVRQLIIGLPMPKTDELMIETQNGQRYVYSPMYVYL